MTAASMEQTVLADGRVELSPERELFAGVEPEDVIVLPS